MKVTKRNRKFLNIAFFVEFIVLTLAIIATAKASPNNNENVNKFCAYVVGIPYASDNFSDEEWVRFQYCRDTLSN